MHAMMMALAVAAADARAAGQVDSIARTFGIDWPHLLAQIVSFSIVCVVLSVLAYRPILQMLAARREQIAAGLANAAKIEAELAVTKAARQHVLTEARVEAAGVLERGRELFARARAQEETNAKAAVARILADAAAAAARDRDQMQAELKREMGHLVVQTAAAVTGKILTAADQRRLLDETTKHLAKP